MYVWTGIQTKFALAVARGTAIARTPSSVIQSSRSAVKSVKSEANAARMQLANLVTAFWASVGNARGKATVRPTSIALIS